MPIFVHIAAEKDAKRITTHMIKGHRTQFRIEQGYEEISHGVYCMPVLPNFHLTHQWLRELKRRGQKTLVGIYFRLSSQEPVWFGHFNQPHQNMPAGEAIKVFHATTDAEGYEIIIPRNIGAKEIIKMRFLPQMVGWRYFPKSHTAKPFCACPYCLSPGSIKSQRLRRRLEAQQE